MWLRLRVNERRLAAGFFILRWWKHMRARGGGVSNMYVFITRGSKKRRFVPNNNFNESLMYQLFVYY